MRPLGYALILAGGLAIMPGAALGCALELILAVDVSGSIDSSEFRLQTNGLADAFEHPSLISAVEELDGGILVTMTHWSGTNRQRQMTHWRRLSDAASMASFAAEVRQSGRAWRNFSTAIGEALAHAAKVSVTAPQACKRRVIDVSGDGVSNEGRPPVMFSRALAAKGYTINGLVIRGADPDPVTHYRSEVIAGPGAFVEIAASFDDYPRAILRKLLREIDQPLILSEREADETTREDAREAARHQPLPKRLPISYIYAVPSGTMAINAPVISGSDPGAVPGGSTNIPSWRDRGPK